MKKPMRLLTLIAALTAVFALAMPAVADIVVNVDQGATQPLPIAIPAFGGADVGARISQVISADLARSELFRPLDPSSFQEQFADANVQPTFDKWKSISAQALLTGQVVSDADGRLRVDFRLWDVYAGEQLLGLQFTSTPENWRRVAHKVADAVYEKLTGAPGYFDTRVVFVAESGTPRFSANSQEITYMALRPSGSTVYLLNIETGRQEALGHFPGMVFAPRFSPDGNRVAFSVEKDGNTDVWLMDLASHATRRLTTDPAIDTSPSFSPSGGEIVFNSDRGGEPELYIMSADGSNAHRISFGGGRYTTPVWSPDGKWIAFTKQDGATFHIGVMKSDGSGERLLTSSYLDEGPSWAPNSRVIMYSHQAPGAGAHLYMVDISGRAPQPAPFPLQASDPAWSALLP